MRYVAEGIHLLLKILVIMGAALAGNPFIDSVKWNIYG